MKKNKPPIIDIIESAIANLQKHEEEINSLNVFPIPDGDTGSNMLSTLLTAWDSIKENSQTDIDIFNDFAKGALLGARGNSGVIVSQIIKGLAVGVEEVGSFSYDRKELKYILSSAKNYSYNAVLKPVEGTILSVIKSLSEHYDAKERNFLDAFKNMHMIAMTSTENTPNQLAILKDAGVVDSGAMGLTYLIEGILKALEGTPLKIKTRELSGKSRTDSVAFIKADPTKNIGYCTEFILTLREPKTFKKQEFLQELEKLGGASVVIIIEDDILKTHVHLKHPGEAFNLAQKYGEFSKIKADNMTTQTESSGHFVDDASNIKITKSKDNELIIIAVSNGIGINREFKELGADYIVNGGQSMNPSVKDFMKIINQIESNNILILPNNSNIILTVETIIKNLKDKNIYYLPTKSILQGIVALYNINKEMVNFNDFKESIMESISEVFEGEISLANRDVVMNNVTVKKNNYVSISRRKVISSESTIEMTFQRFLAKILTETIEILTIFYNDTVTEKQLKELNKILKDLKKQNSDLEINVKYGGQRVYSLLILGE